MDYIALGRHIRRYRVEQNLTQEQMAESAVITASFLGHLERGTRVASLQTLMNICAALEVTPNDLLGEYARRHTSETPVRVTIDPDRLLQEIALLLRMQEKAP